MIAVAYPVDEIRHAARVSVPEQVEDLAVKLRDGFEIPPVWLDATGLLIDGNHRLNATLQAGLPTIRAFVLTEEQDDEYEEMLDEGLQELDAYSELTGLDSPRNHWLRP